MNNREVTEQILAAWDEEQEEEAPEEIVDATTTEEIPEPEPGTPETPEAPEEPEEAEEEAEEGEDEQGEAELEEAEEEAEVRAGFETDDPEILAYLAKYAGDPQEALKAAVNLERVLGRQGRENGQLSQRVRELEAQVQRQQAITPTILLNEEQRQWVENAVESGDPQAFVREALNVEEYDLARAVCEQWAEERPYEAARLASFIDRSEQQTQVSLQQAQEDVIVDHAALMEVLVEHFPQMPTYERQMLSMMETLGPVHPLVQDARSNDPETAARGIIGIYEIARASAATVKSTREKITRDRRQADEDARGAAVVSSAQTSPGSDETPRATRLGPGLTLEDLDRAWNQ